MTHTQLLREADAAAYLKLAAKTLARWRWAGKGPTFHKLGTAVRYSIEDLNQFVADAQVTR